MRIYVKKKTKLHSSYILWLVMYALYNSITKCMKYTVVHPTFLDFNATVHLLP